MHRFPRLCLGVWSILGLTFAAGAAVPKPYGVPGPEARRIAAGLRQTLDDYWVCLRIDPANSIILRSLASSAAAVAQQANADYDRTKAPRYKLLADAALAAEEAIGATAQICDKEALSEPLDPAVEVAKCGHSIERAKDLLRQAGFPFKVMTRFPRPKTGAEIYAQQAYILHARAALDVLGDLYRLASGDNYHFLSGLLATRRFVDGFLRYQGFDWKPPSRNCIARAMDLSTVHARLLHRAQVHGNLGEQWEALLASQEPMYLLEGYIGLANAALAAEFKAQAKP
jgi:hypothetical protein